jgi:hypothetical protein
MSPELEKLLNELLELTEMQRELSKEIEQKSTQLAQELIKFFPF